MEIEMDKLIAEATQALNDLVKSEQTALEQELKKSQGAQAPAATQPAAQPAAPAQASAPAPAAPAPEVKKNESSSSSSSQSSAKKAEDSGYENMSPEASGSGSSSSSSSAPSEGSSPAASAPAPEASGSSSSSSGSPESSGSSSSGSSDSSGSGSSDSSGSGDEDHIGQMLAELDDERLQHLYMKAKAELMARMHRDESPQQPQEQPMDQGAMAMSEKVKELEGKLAKSEAEKESLKKATGAIIDMTDKLMRRPVKKAVTDVKFVERGEGESLTKAEGMSDNDLKKHINGISKDYAKLAKFSPEDRLTLMDFVAGRKPRAEAVKILSK